VTDFGSEVKTLTKGDFVIAPFAISCGVCEFCRAGLQTSCVNGGFWTDANLGTTGCQAEAVRVPLADGTLVKVPGVDPATADEGLLASLLTLSDVYGTGRHAAHRAGVTTGDTVAVIGDGAVGLLAVLSAKQLGAERIILMGRHEARTDLGRELGATDVVAERGQDGINAVVELTKGGAAKSWRPSATCPPTSKQSASSAPPGSSPASASRSTKTARSAGRSSARTRPLPAGQHPCGPTSSSCYLPCSTAPSTPARSSTAPSRSRTPRRVTPPWTPAKLSR
jgi:threonine dehydrogenase-like Zn-dependent dehydrogenase